MQQLTATCRWFIWECSIFKVPITTLQRPKYEGEWDLPNIEAKYKRLLYNRIQILGAKEGSVMADLFRIWTIRSVVPNPPQAHRLPTQLEHLQQYATDMTYVAPQIATETRHAFKRRIYATLLQVTMRENPACELRIIRKYPEVDWKRNWRNFHDSRISSILKSTWYAEINDIIPTHDRLAEIHLMATNTCPRCEHPDSILHRITDCGEGPLLWTWTKQKLGLIVRMDAKYIPKEWTIRPALYLWPPNGMLQ